MVEPSLVKSIQLDETVYNQEVIKLLDKDGFVLHQIRPKPEKAWELFVEILIKWEKEKNETI
jgi:hypothetical protein